MLISIGIRWMLKINYNYLNRGDKTIVFLHGWGMQGNCFDRIISLIDKNFSIIKVDLPGFGKSEKPKTYFDTHEYAYQIFLLLNKIKVKDIILVGHSFGGRLAIILASVYGVKISNLVLTSSAGLNRFYLSKWLKVKFFKLCRKLVKCKVLSKKYLDKFGSRDYKVLDGNMKSVMSRVVNQDLTCFVKKINVRSYLVWDKRDKETPYWICKKINKIINSSEKILYRVGGHFAVFKNSVKFASFINGLKIC